MAVNKVVYGTTVLVDLTQDTVTPEKLLLGTLAHAADGEAISGVFLFCATKCATDFEFFLVEHPCLACLRGHSKVLFFLPKTAEFLHYTSFYGRSWFFQDQPLFASMDFFLIKTGSWLYGTVRRINAVLG